MKIKNSFILSVLMLLLLSSTAFAQGGNAYVIPIHGEINKATSSYVANAVDDIRKEDPSVVIFDINTYGGLIDEAQKIKDVIISLDVPTISFVNNNAQSAGVLITIASEKVVMAPNSSIGSAETIPNNEKTLSLWRAILRDTAQYRNRDTEVIQAMADRDIFIEDISEVGKLINLTSQEALDLGIADYVSSDINEILDNFNISSEVEYVEEGLSVKLAKYVSNPYISTLFLIMGFVGAVIEIFTPGFGIGGTISIIGFGLYFGGNIMAGNANWTSLVLFVLGLVLLIIEAMVPGFGLPGIGGIIFVVVGTVLAMGDVRMAIISLSISIIVTALLSIYLVRIGYNSKIFRKIILNNKLEGNKGYLSNDSMEFLIDKTGVSISELRPAGFIEIDGVKYDVLSEGDFIIKNSAVKVTRVVGSKIFVRRI